MPYQLEIQLPDNDVETIDIVGPCILGSSEQAELSIQDYDLPAQLCRFRIGQGVLTVTNLGAKKPPLKIGKQVLDHGKMYILDNEDVLSYGNLKMIVYELGLDDESDNEDDDPEAAPAFDSTAELLAEDDNQNDEEDHPQTQFQSVTEILRQAGESSDKQEAKAPIDKKDNKEKKREEPPKQSESTQESVKPEKTTSKLLEISQKVKSMLGKKQTPRGPVKVKSPELVSHKNRKPLNSKRSEGWPGIVPRLLAFMIELGGCLLLATPLAQRKEISSQWGVLLGKVDQLALEQPPVVHLSQLLTVLEVEGVLALLLYGVLQVFIGFIFGRSLGYVLMGINEDSGFIAKRIKASLRSLIFFITGPFLIFDLPVLFKKRSFKEWFTRSSFYRPSMWPSILTLGLLVPALALSYFVKFTFSQRRPIPIEFAELVPSGVDSRLTFKSLDLRFPLLTLEERDLLPQIDTEALPNDAGNGLWIFPHGPERQPIGLSPGPDYSLKEWTKNFVEYNYTLPYINAELSQLIESVLTPGPLSPDKRELLQQLFRDSLSELELNAQNVIQLLKTYGPDIAALNKFSVDIKESLDLTKEQTIKWVSFLKRDVLWIEQVKENVLTIQIVFFDTHPFRSIYLTTAIQEDEDKSLAKEFIQEELIQTLPTFPGPSPKGEELQKLSHQASEGMLTLLSQKTTPYEQFDQVYALIFELTGEQLGAPQHIYRETFEKQIQAFIEKINSKREENPEENKGLTRFHQKLQELFQAYQNKKSSFFVEE